MTHIYKLLMWFIALCSVALCIQPALCAPVSDDALLNMSLEDLTNMVTVRKRPEMTRDIPAAITNFPEQMLHDSNIRSFTDYATKIANLSFAYGNGLTSGNPSTGMSNSRTFAIRGIAGARAGGFYVDDIPLQGSVDVRALDLQNIEVLKGPQGTLFGEGSLGGNIRFITHSPDPDRNHVGYMLETGQTDSANRMNFGAETVGNLVLAPGKAALRITAFTDDAAGYLRRTYLSDINNAASARIDGGNQGGQDNAGGSIAGLVRVTPDFDVSARLMFQNQRIRGFPATWAALPGFQPQYTMNRMANIQSSATDKWILPSLSLVYRGSGWVLN